MEEYIALNPCQLVNCASFLEHDKVLVETGVVHTEGTTGCHDVYTHVAFAEPLKEIVVAIKQNKENFIVPQFDCAESRPLSCGSDSVHTW